MKMENTQLHRRACAATLAVGLAALPLAGAAEELNYALGLGPTAAPTLAANDYVTAMAEASGGELTIKLYTLELLSLAEMSPGLRDGLTDIGYVVLSYFTSEFAHSNLLGELSTLQALVPMTGKESLAFSGAMAEYITTRCPECLAEFKAQNQVYLGSAVTPSYMMLCNKPVATVADMKGKRMRVATSTHKHLVEHFGAVGVQMPIGEVYEGLSQGIIDCTLSAAPELTNFRLGEVVTSITTGIPGNVFGSNGSGNVNLDVWTALTPDKREILMKQGAILTAGMVWNYYMAGEADMEKAKAEGKTILAPDAELASQAKAFLSDEVKVLAAHYRDNFGVARADEMQVEFAETLARWSDLVADVDSKEALGELYWTQIFAKLDPATYGLQ